MGLQYDVSNEFLYSVPYQLNATAAQLSLALPSTDNTPIVSRVFNGYSFGYETPISGEVVFNTGMVGYPESLTDPSYTGQLLVLTYPLIGNYGVPAHSLDDLGFKENFEGDNVYVSALVVADYSEDFSHWSSNCSLSDWLKLNKIPAIAGVDTRAITKYIRSYGSCLGKITFGDKINQKLQFDNLKWYDPNCENLVAKVSKKTVKTYSNKNLIDENNLTEKIDPSQTYNLTLVDCGVKNNIIRYLLYHLPFYINLKVVPWDYAFGEDDEMDGLIISNGPGDPLFCQITIKNIKKVMDKERVIPILGICLGHQLMALAIGGCTYKMKFGNRSMNQPVIDLETDRCYITAQNHGYAVDIKTIPKDWNEYYVNANDLSNEGIMHTFNPWFGVQFHPEANGGPTDTSSIFHRFCSFVKSPTYQTRLVMQYMPRIYLKKILILGSGGLSIGQAGEFDYSGSQAIKAIKEANIHVVLINPNIATVQTSSGLADTVYFLPVTPEFVQKVILKEKPEGLLCTFGGQTALNCAIELHSSDFLKKHKCEILGSPIKAILDTEDRFMFSERLKEIGESCAPSKHAFNVNEALIAANEIGYPVLIRTAFALGGLGSGFAYDDESLISLCNNAFATSKQVIVDKSLKGWKEIEYEVLRDVKDNCITICNMENIDPLGIHTGDSIVVAPSQTLSNSDYYRLRETAIKVIRHFGIIGECNIQFALDVNSNKYYIVEVNARLSRSSALASKATGYPLAYISAKLALNITLTQLNNSVTRVTTACCEPSLDYVVIKIPKWDLEKFELVDHFLSSSMKSVGEVMAIGRTFEEALQKGLRMVEQHSEGFEVNKIYSNLDDLNRELENPTPNRIWAIAYALSMGYSVDTLYKKTQIDRWFLYKMKHISNLKRYMSSLSSNQLDFHLIKTLKQYGFSDKQIGYSLKDKVPANHIRKIRINLNIIPNVKQIDTLAAEFPALTNYLYLSYQGSESDVIPLYAPAQQEAVPDINEEDDADIRPISLPSTYIVLGCGCYRIGSSVEFDWTAINCVKTLRQLGHKAIVVNCNPETVSTDYDESDRLYFEELSLESILDIWFFENPSGMIVSVGGQTPNNLAKNLHEAGVIILGTPVNSIDMCEDRNKFSKLCDELEVDQPEWSTFTDLDAAIEFSTRVRFPVLVRPSYVLSGAAMKVVYDQKELEGFLKKAAIVSPEYPIVITKYIQNAKEVEMDSVAREGVILNYAISEHIENAGVHSGDATLILPAQKLYVETIRQVKRISQRLARSLQISGPFNIQFLCKDNDLKIIECNLRASRTFPFISKTYKINLIDQATRVMINNVVTQQSIHLINLKYVGIKMPMFSYNRLIGSDPSSGVEMHSTGEVACFGSNKYEAFLKASISAGMKIPKKSILISFSPPFRVELRQSVVELLSLNYTLYATKTTYEYFEGFLNSNKHLKLSNQTHLDDLYPYGCLEQFLENKQLIRINKKEAPTDHSEITNFITNGTVELVVCIHTPKTPKLDSKSYVIQRGAINSGITLISNSKQFKFFVESIKRMKAKENQKKSFWEIKSWNEYISY